MKLEELTLEEAKVLIDAMEGYLAFKPDNKDVKTLWRKVGEAISRAADHERHMEIRN